MIADYLTTSAFDYSADTNCGFHEEMDNKNCAKGGARRYCYVMSQALCQLFEVSPTAKHLPPKRDNVVVDTYMVDFNDVMAVPAHRYISTHNEPPEDWEPNTSAGPGNEEPQTSRAPTKLMGIGRGFPKR